MSQAQALKQEAMGALREGRHERARTLFRQAGEQEPGDGECWLGLAFSCAHLGDSEAAIAAVDRALELDPHNLRALIFKGDHLTELGRTRKALVFYSAALKLAERREGIPADIQTGLRRANARCDSFAAEYQHYLEEALHGAGYRPESSPRFQQALDIAFGKRQIHYQQPTRFYFPGLPQIEFYPRERFPWLEDLEAGTDAIREELRGVLAARSFEPYLRSSPDSVPINDSSNLDSTDWGAFYFYQGGEKVEANAARCPETMSALDAAPLPLVPGSTPHALYSRLAANTRIPPHNGLINTRLICHLPLIVPPNCGGLRVGGQIQEWREGSAYVFDDSVEHEAWNDSAEERVVLLFDIWRPEPGDEEKHWISTTLQAIDAYESEPDH